MMGFIGRVGYVCRFLTIIVAQPASNCGAVYLVRYILYVLFLWSGRDGGNVFVAGCLRAVSC